MRSRRSGAAETTTADTHHPHRAPLSSGNSPLLAPSSSPGGALDISDMDPWKDDRCRDFIVLNTIQRLRAYHLPSDAAMPEVEPAHLIRSRNLVMLPRARPDFRPCLGERKPTRAERQEERRQARRERLAVRRAATPRTDSVSPSSSSSDSEMSSSSSSFAQPEEETAAQEHSATTPDSAPDGRDTATTPSRQQQQQQQQASANICAVDRARALFFGAQSFFSSTSPRHLVGTPHVPVTPSPSPTGRKRHTDEREVAHEDPTHPGEDGEGGARRPEEPLSTVVVGRSLKDDLEAFFSPDSITEGQRKVPATEEAAKAPPPLPPTGENAVEEEVEQAEQRSGLPQQQDTNPHDGASPAPKQTDAHPPDSAGDAAAAAPTYASCDVTAVLLAHFQSLLTRGVVLDKLNHKELGFAWWVVGKEMRVAALEESARPPRREALLITLRNFYYGMLSENKRRVPGPGKPSAAASAALEGEGAPATAHGRQPGDSGEGDETAHSDVEAMTPAAGGRGRRTAAADRARASPRLEHAGQGGSGSGTARRSSTMISAGKGRQEAEAGVGEGTASEETEEEEGPQRGAERPNRKGQRSATAAKEPDAGRRQREATREEDSPVPRANAESHEGGGDDRDRDSDSAAEAREDGSARVDDVAELHGDGEGSGGGGGSTAIVSGRGRTHGQQGKAAARRKIIEATWRPLRTSHRRGASVTAPPSEESSNLVAPPPATAGVRKPDSAPAAKAAAQSLEGEEKSASAEKKMMPNARKGAAAKAAVRAVPGSVVSASREASLPGGEGGGEAVPATAGGKKRQRAGTAAKDADVDAGKVSKQQPATTSAAACPDASKPSSSASGKGDVPQAAVAAAESNEEQQPPPLPPALPVPPPREEELAAAAREAYVRATEAYHLLPTPLDQAIEARVTRRMSAGVRRGDAGGSSSNSGLSRSAEQARNLSTQSSYAFLLASAAHLPPKPAVKKKRRVTRAQVASPWESATTPTTTTTTTTSGTEPADEGEDTGTRSVSTPRTPRRPSPARGPSDEERQERRGRKKKPPPSPRADECDVDGAVDPILLLSAVRHDQAHLEGIISHRLARSQVGEAATALPSASVTDRAGKEVGKARSDEETAVKAEPTREEPFTGRGQQTVVVKEELQEEAGSSLPLGQSSAVADTPLSVPCLEQRREALLSTPFPQLPYALQCLLTWEAADLLARHRAGLVRRHRKRQRTAGLQRQKGPMTRRMAALAARGELPSTSSGSSTTTGSDDDGSDTDGNSSSDGESEQQTGDSDGEDGGTADDATHGDGGGRRHGRAVDAESSRKRARTGSLPSAPRTDLLPHPWGCDQAAGHLPRQLMDYWAEFRSA